MQQELEGALLVLSGWFVGRVGGRRAKAPAPPEPPGAPKPICDGCGHHRSWHKDSGACVHREYREGPMEEIQKDSKGRVVRDMYGQPVIHKVNRRVPLEPCACPEYSGPEPLADYYLPEVAE